MKVSTKGDYGIRAIIELAHHYGEPKPTQSGDIAARQGVPESYLEQLLTTLRRAGFVRSVRGPQGGHLLVRDPAGGETLVPAAAGVVCAECQSTVAPGRFCGSCGKPLPQQAAEPGYCTGCGTPLAADANFCGHCGRKRD